MSCDCCCHVKVKGWLPDLYIDWIPYWTKEQKMSGEHSFFFYYQHLQNKNEIFHTALLPSAGCSHTQSTDTQWLKTNSKPTLLLEAVSNMDFTVINRSVYSEMILHWMYMYSWLLTTNITLLFLKVYFLYSNCHFTINDFRFLKNCCRYSSGSKFNSMYMYINICNIYKLVPNIFLMEYIF